MTIPRTDVRLSVAVMHHPARPELLERLLRDLQDELQSSAYERVIDGARVEVEVVEDPEPFAPASPWRTAQTCWAWTPDWCTHRLVLQDDAMPCIDFVWAAVEAIRHRPTALVAMFMGWAGTWMANDMRAAGDTSSWYLHPDRQWLPCVAMSMPRDLARDLAAYDPPDERAQRADDEAIAWWSQQRTAQGRPVECWVTIPSLVQHDDDAPSTMLAHREGQKARWEQGQRMRRAACWIGDRNPREVDWTKGLA